MISKKEIIDIINDHYKNIEEFTLLTILDAIKNHGLTSKEDIENMLNEADYIMKEVNDDYIKKRAIKLDDFYFKVRQLADEYNISYLLITDKKSDSNDLNNSLFNKTLEYFDSLKDDINE